METYSDLSIDAGAVVNSGEIAIGVGTVTVTTPLMTNSGSIGISGGSLLTVNGNVLDTGNLEIDLGSSANISGTLTQTAGDVQVDGALSASRMVCEGGTLGGAGSITANVEVGCLMSPGDSPGRMDIFGNFILDAGGELMMEIGPHAWDQLFISGEADFYGNLEILFLAGFQFQPGLSYDLFSWGSLGYAFDPGSISFEGLGQGYGASFDPLTGELQVNSSSGVPEPATYLLLGTALLALSLTRRTHR